MGCPHLAYRRSDGDREFDHERPYCTIQEEFVSPMKADICNDRFEFDHREDCEIFKAHREDAEPESPIID